MYNRLSEQSIHDGEQNELEEEFEMVTMNVEVEEVPHHTTKKTGAVIAVVASTAEQLRTEVFWNVIASRLLASFRSLKGSPRELYYCYFLNYCESYGYFALSQIIVLYLHNEFGVSDMEAGIAYGMWGASITFWGFSISCLNDKLGVRKSLLIGFSISAIASFLIAMATSKQMVYAVLFGLLPVGNCIGIPMLTVGVKRCTTPQNRGFAFGLYYAVMNIAAFVSGPVVDFFNIVMPSNNFLSGNRLVIISITCTYICSLLVTLCLVRDLGKVGIGEKTEVAYETISPLTESTATETGDHNDSISSDADNKNEAMPTSIKEIIIELLQSKTFWRFCCFTMVLINLRTIFRHMDATLPTYLIRCFGVDFPKGMIYSINPFMIIFLTPVVSALTTNYAHYDMIKYGGYISALSPFFMVLSTSTWAVVLFMVFLSIGESIWSPRLYDYTMSIAPNGKEATFSSLASVPLFAAKIPVGLLSGYLLSTYLPENTEGCPEGKSLWLFIGLMTCLSPILITALEKCIREPPKEGLILQTHGE